MSDKLDDGMSKALVDQLTSVLDQACWIAYKVKSHTITHDSTISVAEALQKAVDIVTDINTARLAIIATSEEGKRIQQGFNLSSKPCTVIKPRKGQ